MTEIGGYFELELPKGCEFHANAIRLNTGRNALEYILRVKEYKKVYIPYYTCDAILEPLKKLNIAYEFYSLSDDFSPIFDFNRILQSEAFLYINYFGLFNEIVNRLQKLVKNMIVDNSQAFYELPSEGCDTFYSARKYFGVPDGAYLFVGDQYPLLIEEDYSADRFQHLLGRIDRGAKESYLKFRENEDKLSFLPIRSMSKLTCAILRSIDYESIALKRRRNFEMLDATLGGTNELNLNKLTKNQVPMVYPYLSTSLDILENLLQNGIFVARYWTDVLSKNLSTDSFEFNLATRLVALPIDQRQSESDIEFIARTISRLGS